MGLSLFYPRVVTLLVLHLIYIWLDEVDCCVSQWDPFCKEETLYIPYVRIFQKGRHGAMLKDRGPGFIDVEGLQDIYVCTNGLVMLYYSKPKGNGGAANGEIYEHGELHWAPHHCELYNPSCSSDGMDQPKKTLVSILLIAHPQDYRLPALQMFVAPTYDVVYQQYVNLTSLIMISTEGQCILEKGVERAQLRIRITEPKLDPPPPEPTAWFCQLDSQRKLGQTGIINLKKHAEFPKYQETTLDQYEFGPEVLNKKTGPAFSRRFKASDIEDMNLLYSGTEGEPIALDADRVYAALLNDRPMQFVGCLQYPDFSPTQLEILEATALTITGNTSAGIKELKLEDERMYVPDANEPEFWAHEVEAPWHTKPSGTKTKRFDLYANGWSTEEYKDAKLKVDGKKEELATAIKNNDPDIETKRQDLKEEEMKFSLWPYREIYIAIQKYTIDLEIVLVDQWKATMDVIDLNRTPGAVSTVDLNDITTYDAKTAGGLLPQLLRNLSSDLFDRRFDPYYPELATLYNDNLSKLKQLRKQLRIESIHVGPYISDAESFYSEYKLYKMLTKKTLTDFENAIKLMEKTKQSVPKPTFGMPYDRYFADVRIAISDACDNEASVCKPELNPDPGAKACYPLPAPKETCRGIKPTTQRACQLSKNVKGQGIDWGIGNEWKQRVLDLIESIHKQVCPYISEEFAISVNRLLKGYLIASPQGTGLTTPVNGSRMFKVDHNYQGSVYNSTYLQMGNTSDLVKEPFWDQIIASLEDCDARAKAMLFNYNEDGDRPTFITLRKVFPNKTNADYEVKDLFMQEKADYEFSFNWAIDMSWRIFATVLGYCMPHYENSIPLISAQFYALYTKHFLHPLRQIWMSNRDNIVLKTILGSFYGTGKGDRWSKICMESSFVESGDRSYRPPRYLYVNAFTEMNYFTTGPMSGTSGRLVDAII